MHALKLNEFLEIFDNFTSNEKEYILEIINKQVADDNRRKIIKRVKEARMNFKKGKVKSGNLKALYQDLENE